MSHPSPMARCHEPGLLWVTSRPKPAADHDEYHHWYNTEHGPARLQLDFVQNGYRYVSKDTKEPVYAGMYDIHRMSALTEPRYTNLRKFRSAREQHVMKTQMDILERKMYRRISSRGECPEAAAPTILRVSFVVKQEHADEVHRWYEEEHLDDLVKIPGWRRSRRFEWIDGDAPLPGCTELLAIHEFDAKNGLGGPAHMLAREKPWRNRIVNLAESRNNTPFAHFHTFRASDYQHPPDMTPLPPSRRMSMGGGLFTGLPTANGVEVGHSVRLAAPQVLPAVS